MKDVRTSEGKIGEGVEQSVFVSRDVCFVSKCTWERDFQSWVG